MVQIKPESRIPASGRLGHGAPGGGAASLSLRHSTWAGSPGDAQSSGRSPDSAAPGPGPPKPPTHKNQRKPKKTQRNKENKGESWTNESMRSARDSSIREARDNASRRPSQPYVPLDGGMHAWLAANSRWKCPPQQTKIMNGRPCNRVRQLRHRFGTFSRICRLYATPDTPCDVLNFPSTHAHAGWCLQSEVREGERGAAPASESHWPAAADVV